MTLSAPSRAPTCRQARRVADRPGRDDRPLTGHQPRDRGDRPEAARVGQREVGARQVVGSQRVRARLLDEGVVGVEERVEAQTVGAADHRHHERARAVLALDVDREAEVHAAVVDAVRLAVDRVEVVRHHGQVGRRPHDRIGDQVRERDPPAGGLELLATGVERRHGERPERGRGRDRAALVHVAGEYRGAAAQLLRRAGAVGLLGRALGRRGGRAATFERDEDIVLADATPGAAAGDRAQVDAVGGRDPARDGRRGDVAVGGGLGRRWRRGVGGAGAVPGRRRLGAGGAGAGYRPRPPRSGGRQSRERLAHVDRLAVGDEQLEDRAALRGGHLGVDLVGRDRDERLVLGDRVAGLLVPLDHGALGDRLAHLRHDDLERPGAVSVRVRRGLGGGPSGAGVAAGAPSPSVDGRDAGAGVDPAPLPLAEAPLPPPAAGGHRGALGADRGERLPDVDGVALVGEDLGQGAARGRGHLGVDLVGRDRDDRLVLGDLVPGLLVPLEDRPLGDRLAHLGHDQRRGANRHTRGPTIAPVRSGRGRERPCKNDGKRRRARHGRRPAAGGRVRPDGRRPNPDRASGS